MNEEIEVTGYCFTYNHVDFIRDALDGFVNQKTSFKYQIIVFDDASTDGTREIVEAYAQKYPEIIIPILPSENTYSKNLPRLKMFIEPHIKGKYITICEGDDYWCDENKLQKQYDVLNNRKDCVACVHNTVFWNVKNGKKSVGYQTKNNRILQIPGVLKEGGAEYHTSSLMFRREYYFIPEGFFIHSVGDYPRAVYLALSGHIFYLKDVMSVSRRNVNGSWTSRQSKSDKIRVLEDSIDMLKYADKYSHYQFHTIINHIIKEKELYICVNNGDKTSIKKYKNVLRRMNKKERLKIYIKVYFPHLFSVFQKINNR